ncbi:HAD-IIIC family phosphatase [Geotalea uraniireducens]|uniref:FkbH like protein n=1 Tax=Geotalea uraniireducens (strain Rf4) TaxID=351605 RepID=A5G6D9_GEOUR|nr:HAD-IIIC family phosphatase [Geotalea uraniireducens]ABQ27357.1 FkbH like protein [Geotalea uraniireducens Rf4]
MDLIQRHLNTSFWRYEAQSTLFATRPSRLALQSIVPDVAGMKKIFVNVWRNHAFEPVASLTLPYIAYGCWQAEFRLGDYDDTLMFANHTPADVELIWLDSSRYLSNTSFAAWTEWLIARLKALRSATTAPVIIATWLENDAQRIELQTSFTSMPAVYFADVGAVCSEAGVNLIDFRSVAMAGTPVSNAAQPLIARKLACHWLPAAVFPPMKAVALDLDNTLHIGVLGEDGIKGVQLSQQHRNFQFFLKSLLQRGIFITLVSRNERPDVETLFNKRDDYPLKWGDFSVTEVSWGEKATAIKRIADTLRISPDAVLFVDDNPGELASVAAQLPQVHTVFANLDASLTQLAVEHFPGLWRWKIEDEDAKRVQDMKANAEREKLLAETFDTADYFRSLEVSLTYHYNPVNQLSRLADLCNKTNQFNLALRRFNQAEVAERLECVNACVASVHMKDRLSDSGVIAVLVCERNNDQLIVEELCVSCRALGRQLEDTIILGAIRGMSLFTGCRKVAFRVLHGPRNQPALKWLSRLFAMVEVPEPGLYTLQAERIENFVSTDGITLIKE